METTNFLFYYSQHGLYRVLVETYENKKFCGCERVEILICGFILNTATKTLLTD